MEFPPPPPHRLVEAWLERSGNHPLDISLDFPLLRGSYEFNVWHLIKRSVPRWKSLTLSCEGHSVNQLIVPLFGEARQLSELNLSIYDYTRSYLFDDFTKLVPTLGRLSSLRRLCLGVKGCGLRIIITSFPVR
jgi:hypothetical protein